MLQLVHRGLRVLHALRRRRHLMAQVVSGSWRLTPISMSAWIFVSMRSSSIATNSASFVAFR